MRLGLGLQADAAAPSALSPLVLDGVHRDRDDERAQRERIPERMNASKEAQEYVLNGVIQLIPSQAASQNTANERREPLYRLRAGVGPMLEQPVNELHILQLTWGEAGSYSRERTTAIIIRWRQATQVGCDFLQHGVTFD